MSRSVFGAALVIAVASALADFPYGQDASLRTRNAIPKCYSSKFPRRRITLESLELHLLLELMVLNRTFQTVAMSYYVKEIRAD